MTLLRVLVRRSEALKLRPGVIPTTGTRDRALPILSIAEALRLITAAIEQVA